MNATPPLNVNLSKNLLLWPTFIAAYAMLDAVSYAHGFHGLPISPWNPNCGLAFAMLMRHGLRFAPAVVLAGVAADQIVRDMPLALSIPTEIVTACAYALAARVMIRRLRIAPPIAAPRDLGLFILGATAAAAAATLVRITLAWNFSPFEQEWAGEMFLRQWVGDLIGICLFTPLFLRLSSTVPKQLVDEFNFEHALQFLTVLATAAVVFGFEATDEFQYFYLIFIPLNWIALRGGLGAVLLAAAVVQVSMMAGAVLRDMDDSRVAALQYLMLTLTLSSALLAAAAEAQRKAEAATHARMHELARLSRIHTSSEIAAGIAHELKQPMLAVINYVGAAIRLLERDPPELDEALRLMRNTDAQVMRADAVIRRMRDFTRKGEAALERTDLAPVLQDAVEMTAPLARKHGASIQLLTAGPTYHVLVDPVQMLQVAVNLLTNAVHAVAESQKQQRLIWIELKPEGSHHLQVTVCDTGNGLDPDNAEGIFEPFVTTRREGMGVGLAISRAIVEAHGGELWHDAPEPGRGAVFHFRIPIEADHAAD